MFFKSKKDREWDEMMKHFSEIINKLLELGYYQHQIHETIRERTQGKAFRDLSRDEIEKIRTELTEHLNFGMTSYKVVQNRK